MRPMLGSAIWALVALEGPVLEGSMEVRWRAPQPGCPTEVEARRRIVERVGDRLAPETAMTVEAVVERAEGALVLRLTVMVDDEVQVRSLRAPVCDELLDATALIAALALEPPEETSEPVPGQVVEPGPEPESEPEPATELIPSEVRSQPEPAPEPIPSEDRSKPEPEPDLPQPRRDLGGLVGTGAGVMGGGLPGIGAEVRAGAALLWRRFIVAAELVWAPRRTVALDGFEDRGALVQSWHIGLEGGLRWPVSERVSLPLTLGIELGAIHARGFGVQSVASQARPWIAPSAALGLHVGLVGRFGLWTQGRVAVPVARPVFAIEGRGPVFTTASVSASIALGVFVRWG